MAVDPNRLYKFLDYAPAGRAPSFIDLARTNVRTASSVAKAPSVSAFGSTMFGTKFERKDHRTYILEEPEPINLTSSFSYDADDTAVPVKMAVDYVHSPPDGLRSPPLIPLDQVPPKSASKSRPQTKGHYFTEEHYDNYFVHGAYLTKVYMNDVDEDYLLLPHERRTLHQMEVSERKAFLDRRLRANFQKRREALMRKTNPNGVLGVDSAALGSESRIYHERAVERQQRMEKGARARQERRERLTQCQNRGRTFNPLQFSSAPSGPDEPGPLMNLRGRLRGDPKPRTSTLRLWHEQTPVTKQAVFRQNHLVECDQRGKTYDIVAHKNTTIPSVPLAVPSTADRSRRIHPSVTTKSIWSKPLTVPPGQLELSHSKTNEWL
eukprot:Rmarinus@m.3793